jgi:hypothetical protein
MKGIARLLIVAGLVVSGLGAGQAQTHHYKDNGDGTVSDLDTGLMWEKKTGTLDNEQGVFCRDPKEFPRPQAGYSACPHVHDVNNRYQWSRSIGREPDGAAFTEFLATLNGDLSWDGKTITGCFANHCDWRLPNIDELETILDRRVGIDAIFGPTHPEFYWSATTWREDRTYAWAVRFRTYGDDLLWFGKHGYLFVRAVRGGS